MQSCKSEFCEWGMRDNLNRELCGWHQLKHWGIVTILDFVSKALCSNYPEISAPIYILDFGWSSWRPAHWCCVVVLIWDIALRHWIEPLNWIVILEPLYCPSHISSNEITRKWDENRVMRDYEAMHRVIEMQMTWICMMRDQWKIYGSHWFEVIDIFHPLQYLSLDIIT